MLVLLSVILCLFFLLCFLVSVSLGFDLSYMEFVGFFSKVFSLHIGLDLCLAGIVRLDRIPVVLVEPVAVFDFKWGPLSMDTR